MGTRGFAGVDPMAFSPEKAEMMISVLAALSPAFYSRQPLASAESVKD
jgi:hypothetical protein